MYLYSAGTALEPVAIGGTTVGASGGPIFSDTRNELRVWSPGNAGAVDTATPASQQIRFRDPESGTVYAAKVYGTEQINSKMPLTQTTGGARMLQYAQQLADYAYNTTGTIADSDGSGFVYNTYDITTPKDATSAAKLHGYLALLDSARDLATWWDVAYTNFTEP
jgi:hypothetical protein